MEKTKITISQIVKTKPAKFGFTTMVKAQEFGDKKIFMINTKTENSIQVGKSYEGTSELWKKMDDGTEFMTWKWVSKEDKVAERLEIIQNTLLKHTMMLTQIGNHLMPPKDNYNAPTTPDEIDEAFANAGLADNPEESPEVEQAKNEPAF